MTRSIVILRRRGTHELDRPEYLRSINCWIPAFAGMTWLCKILVT